VGCITNNVVSMHSPGQDESQRAAGAMGQVMPLFDAIIESSKAGVRKPDPRIYLMMCELLAVEPGRCVYLDDLGVNCKPAAALGMRAIKVVDVDQTLADLAEATGLTFGAEEPA
jgi:putative hydrolase of the HAD superfamily